MLSQTIEYLGFLIASYIQALPLLIVTLAPLIYLFRLPKKRVSDVSNQAQLNYQSIKESFLQSSTKVKISKIALYIAIICAWIYLLNLCLSLLGICIGCTDQAEKNAGWLNLIIVLMLVGSAPFLAGTFALIFGGRYIFKKFIGKNQELSATDSIKDQGQATNGFVQNGYRDFLLGSLILFSLMTFLLIFYDGLFSIVLNHQRTPKYLESLQIAKYNSEGFLVTKEGMTLYVRQDALVPFDQSLCKTDCLKHMIPFYAGERDDKFADTKPFFLLDFGNDKEHNLFVKNRQWSINDQYLYTSTLDHQAGEKNAVIASHGYWQNVKPQTPPFYGEVLNFDDPRMIPGTERNLMLQLRNFSQNKVIGPPYIFDRAQADPGECSGACLDDFMPFLFTTITNPALGPLNKVSLKNNSSHESQWAYEERFIYLPKAKKSALESYEIAKKYGLTPIIQESCYTGNQPCEARLKDPLNDDYWSSQ